MEENDHKVLTRELRFNAWFPFANYDSEYLITEKSIDLLNAYILVDDNPKLELFNTAAILECLQNEMQTNGI